jgi:hypothetical protein
MTARSVKLVALGAWMVSGGILVAVACAQAQPAAPKPGASASQPFPVTTVVTFDVKAKTVQPKIGLLRTGDSVVLAVKGLAAGQTLEIDFRVQASGVKGPFARSQKVRGRYTFAADGQVTAGPVDTRDEEAWKFDVVLRQKDDTEDVWGIDPIIVIKQ